MNKSKIEWCDYTWNPVTGCLHGCKYCYAEKISNRFSKWGFLKGNRPVADANEVLGGLLHDLKKPYTKDFPDENGPIDPYPFGFEPTFHQYRLEEPNAKTKPSKVFVCSMADLFGDWVPTRWIGFILNEVEKCKQHTFLFLTKNPARYEYFKFPENAWIGATITNQYDASKVAQNMKTINKNIFLSIEPLLDEINLFDVGLEPQFGVNLLKEDDENHFYNINSNPFKWVIVGAQTGPGSKPTKPEWVQSIIDQCRETGVPMFLKNNLNWPEKIQEWPEGLEASHE